MCHHPECDLSSALKALATPGHSGILHICYLFLGSAECCLATGRRGEPFFPIVYLSEMDRCLV